jgi:pyruvate dehydrogenase E1 component beta subunit
MGKRGAVTIVTYGVMRQVVQRALAPYKFNHDYYADEYQMLCDVIDLRCLYPIDWAFIKKMLERTGKLLIVEPDVTYGGIGAEIAATISEEMPHVRVKRLGAPRATIPASKSLHERMLPTEGVIVDAIRNW